jgi:hypothetical protein
LNQRSGVGFASFADVPGMGSTPPGMPSGLPDCQLKFQLNCQPPTRRFSRLPTFRPNVLPRPSGSSYTPLNCQMCGRS